MSGTRCINYRELAQQVKHLGRAKAVRNLTEALAEKHLRPEDFRIRELCEAFMGREFVQNLHPKSGRYVSLQEADGSAVAYGHFSNITGQIFFTMTKSAYENEEFVFSKVVPNKPTELMDIEKIPGITGIGDEASTVNEGDPYPFAGVSEDYQEVGAKLKRGFIVPVTKEAIFGDRTGFLLERCRKGGYWMGVNKEKRIIDALIDENTRAASIAAGGHRYHWKGTSYGSYQSSTPWANIKTSNALVDWTDVEGAELLLAAMVDPYTGEPILVKPTHIVVTPQNLHTARRIIGATNVQLHSGGYATSGNLVDTHSPNTLDTYQILTSRLLAARAATDTDWWFGAPGEAVAYFENWGITPEEAPANSPDAFLRDIVNQFKISEKGDPFVMEPRVMVENQA